MSPSHPPILTKPFSTLLTPPPNLITKSSLSSSSTLARRLTQSNLLPEIISCSPFSLPSPSSSSSWTNLPSFSNLSDRKPPFDHFKTFGLFRTFLTSFVPQIHRPIEHLFNAAQEHDDDIARRVRSGLISNEEGRMLIDDFEVDYSVFHYVPGNTVRSFIKMAVITSLTRLSEYVVLYVSSNGGINNPSAYALKLITDNEQSAKRKVLRGVIKPSPNFVRKMFRTGMWSGVLGGGVIWGVDCGLLWCDLFGNDVMNYFRPSPDYKPRTTMMRKIIHYALLSTNMFLKRVTILTFSSGVTSLGLNYLGKYGIYSGIGGDLLGGAVADALFGFSERLLAS